MKLTEAQIELLELLTLRPNGAIIRGPELRDTLDQITHSGLVSDVYEMPSGGMSARITYLGRSALRSQHSTHEGRAADALASETARADALALTVDVEHDKLIAKLEARVAALEAALTRLRLAADDVDLGRSVHNSRFPEQLIEGPVWNALRDASHAARALAYDPV